MKLRHLLASSALLLTSALGLAPAAYGDSAGATVRRAQAGMLDAGDDHACAVLDSGAVRCWGNNAVGKLGYADPRPAVGDDETPDTVGPVDLGSGRTARAVA